MISFVVDKLPIHYYQAELLLHSLEQNTSYTKKDIVVQCLDRIDDKFIDYLKDNGYTYNIIAPYLDGKYCNKLQQLEYFIDKDIDGVILMDTDMFVIGDLSDIGGNEIIAKRVDAPNPILSTLQNIYKKASLEMPTVLKSDWDMPNNETFQNNFNGGFYYLPQQIISTMSREWKKWGKWLYAQPELFENKSQFIHVDQISFSLAIHSNNLKYKLLSANYNFPIHSTLKLSSFETTKEIKIIHYHKEIDDYGLLNFSKLKNIKTIDTVKRANFTILKKDPIIFYKDFKKSQLPNLFFTNKVAKFEQKLKNLTKKRAKPHIYLHAGTPKTGTTSLQYHLVSENESLKKNGFLYPSNFSKTGEPKHQWIVSSLLANDFDAFFEHISYTFDEAEKNKCSNIILSTEGIYNHWFDYSGEAKAVLKLLSVYFNISLIVFFRDRVEFIDALYRQYIKNPKNFVGCYGMDLSFEEMLKDDWFLKHLDYLGFIYDCAYIFKECNVKVLNYSKDIVQDFYNELGIGAEDIKQMRHNKGLSHISIELLRVINRYDISKLDRENLLQKLSECDKILQNYSNTRIILEKSRYKLQDKILLSEFFLPT